VPRHPKEAFHLELSFWQSWVRVDLQKQVTLQAKVQYNNHIQPELASCAIFESFKAKNVHKATAFRRQPCQSG
jgi:hypothetical protein